MDLRERGLLLITGHSVDEGGANGSGKSSLSNKGLLWTLFGQTAGGEKADAVVNRFRGEGEETFGEIEFESTDGSRFRLHRGRNPNRLLLYDLVGTKNISATTEKETQRLVERILGRNRETFLQTDFFGQGKAASFLDLTPKAQVELLENILPFERLNELHDNTKTYLNQVKAGCAKYQRQADETQGQLQECQRQERVLSASVDKWEQDQLHTIVYLTEQVAALQVTGEVQHRIRTLEATLDGLHNPIELARTIEEGEAELANLRPYVKTYRDLIAQADRDMHKLKYVPEPEKAPVCPTCKAPFDLETQQRLIRAYAEYMEKRNAIVQTQETAMEYLAQVEIAMTTWQSTITGCNGMLRSFNGFQQELNTLRVQTNVLKLTQTEIALTDAKDAKNPYAILYEENAKRMNSVVSHYNAFKAKIDEMAKEVISLEFWLGSFNKELKNELLRQVCPFLEQKSNIHLGALGNPQIKVAFQTTKVLKNADERNEFTVSVESTTGGGTYESLSGGEKQLVNFAVGMALADLAESQVDGPAKLSILDEPFVALDQRNSELVVNYLQTVMAKKKDTILLVSNEEALKMLIPNQIRVVKERGISRLEQ